MALKSKFLPLVEVKLGDALRVPGMLAGRMTTVGQSPSGTSGFFSFILSKHFSCMPVSLPSRDWTWWQDFALIICG